MRSHAARYAACVVLACVAAVVVAVPVFGQTTATLVGAGDIANCTHNNDEATAQLLGSTLRSLTPDGSLPPLDQARVLAMGDNAYPRGTRAQFANCYDNYFRFSPYDIFDSTRTDWWGQYKDRTMPVLGNHEYMNSSDSSIASKPYFEYFSETTENNVTGFKGPAAPVPNDPTKNQFGLTFGKGYYSYDLGSWHIVALNSNCEKVGGCDANSPQGQWLQQDLASAANTNNQCTLAYFHHPLHATGTGTRTPNVKPFWDMLYSSGADVILSGHAHRYERHAPRNPDGQLDPTNGIRQFVVGTGGEPGGSEIDTTQVPNYQEPLDTVQIGTFGVLKLDLGADSYSWTFVPIAGQTFTDSGSGPCHGAPSGADTTPPDTTIDSGPSGTVNTRSATFTFSSSEAGSTFECSLDNADIAAFSACSSPKKYTGLANGNHTFYVTATDAAGNTDQTPASRTWTVRR